MEQLQPDRVKTEDVVEMLLKRISTMTYEAAMKDALIKNLKEQLADKEGDA